MLDCYGCKEHRHVDNWLPRMLINHTVSPATFSGGTGCVYQVPQGNLIIIICNDYIYLLYIMNIRILLINSIKELFVLFLQLFNSLKLY